ncbi:type I secretion system permease/ATPase [Arvimicrobium flavum]|uniref:type I secretion system permease/ATPase n=1 Tax=Arvimicrobium flavum TaxID=3393320 RepID=UPI00237C2C8D|nr:type I secretion system permease/ATPase [Mesorhizobium shangrilense]
MSKADNLLSQAFREGRGGFITALVFSFFINLLAFVGPLYMLQVYDRVITSRNETTLVMITLIAAFLLVVFAVLERARSGVLNRVGAIFDGIAKDRLFAAVAKGSLRSPNAGGAQALRDLDSVREFLTGSGLVSFCDAPWVPIFVAGCFILHPFFGYVALAGAIIIFALALGNEFLTRSQLKEASQNSVVANNWASAVFRNVEVLHAMGMVNALRSRWRKQHDAVIGWQSKASDRGGNFIAGTKFVRSFLQICILGVGAYLVIEGSATPGAMIAASIIMGRALAPVEAAVANWRGFAAARAARTRILALLENLPSDQERVTLPTPQGVVSVENVLACPPGTRMPSLRGVTFALKPGDVLGVIGPSAAGKSTLARTLVGVWPTVSGAVRLDGSELQHWSPEQLGQHVGYLPQDIELFSGTIAENIARFLDGDSSKIIDAARLAGVHEMIQSLPEGYNTRIGDQGAGLSGGQRQRIGLARAFYNQPALIVLDEPNSNLDAEGEAALINGIKIAKERGSTIILVTHKTNVLGIADKILVLMNGQVQHLGDRQSVLGKLMGPRVAQLNQPEPPTGGAMTAGQA